MISSGTRLLIFVGSSLLAIVLMTLLVRSSQAPTPASDTSSQTFQNPLKGLKLYTDPSSNAIRQADAWRSSRPDDATAMARLAAQPTAKWLTSSASIDQGLQTYLYGARQAQATALLVAYNIPHRDCGLYSAGGASSLASYRSYIDRLALAIDDHSAIIILEPDAIPNINTTNDSGKACLTTIQRQEQYKAFNYAVKTLGRLDNVSIYIDAGNSAWINNTSKLAETLRKAGIGAADGFSLNVSNFQTNADTISYGKQLSKQLDNKHFIIDTSRNGNGPYQNLTYPDVGWCNPPDRALGHYPTTNTGQPLVDAFLYIKAPGESDGSDPDPDTCFDGPAAGQWWPEYALGLIKRWPHSLQPDSTD